MKRRRFFKPKHEDIAPDEIFLDDKNLPDFDVQQFEGRIERPIRSGTIIFVGSVFLLVFVVFLGRTALLQLRDGSSYVETSERNRLDHQLIFPERGIITDRNGVELAWNAPPSESLGYAERKYTEVPGFGHVLGFLQYPARDKSGVYYRTDYEADVGVEAYYNEQLRGKKGLRIIETDALGRVMSGNVIDPPLPGAPLRLSLDARMQEEFHRLIAEVSASEDYRGGAAAIMDIHTGELLTLVSYPEFDPNVMTAKTDQAKLRSYNTDPSTPFLNRAVAGLYTPGSIVKPMFALGALEEGIIGPNTLIESVGYISIPNPYFPDKDTRFNDWKAHGLMDMRVAIAQSSNVYFYEIAGGYRSQKGLGIAGLERYARAFGYGSTTGVDVFGEVAGIIPNPEWKKKHFPTDPTWRIGDTYFTGIGQYGMQATLMQALREAGIIASKGLVVTPHLATHRTQELSSTRLPFQEKHFNVIHEGMRRGVLTGTANVLGNNGLRIAAKTGTAELGVTKARVNSWVIGFFPVEDPKYAFAVVMDRGVKGNATNASYVASRFFPWFEAELSTEYLPINED